MNATVEFLNEHAIRELGNPPELPAYTDSQSFIAGIAYAAEVANYSMQLANQRVAIKALDGTDDPNDPGLDTTSLKVSVCDSVRVGLVKALRLFPVAIQRIERIRRELPADARLN